MIIETHLVIKLMYENSWLVLFSVNIQNSLCGLYESHGIQKKQEKIDKKKEKSDFCHAFG